MPDVQKGMLRKGVTAAPVSQLGLDLPFVRLRHEFGGSQRAEGIPRHSRHHPPHAPDAPGGTAEFSGESHEWMLWREPLVCSTTHPALHDDDECEEALEIERSGGQVHRSVGE